MKKNFIFAGLITLTLCNASYGISTKQIKQGLLDQANQDKNIKVIFSAQGTSHQINKKLDKKRKQLTHDITQAHEQGNIVKAVEYDGLKLVARRGFNIQSLMVIANQHPNRGLIIYIVPQH